MADQNNLLPNTNSINGNSQATDPPVNLTSSSSESELENLESHPLLGFNRFLSAKNSMELLQKRLGRSNQSLPSILRRERYSQLTSGLVATSKSFSGRNVKSGSCLASRSKSQCSSEFPKKKVCWIDLHRTHGQSLLSSGKGSQQLLQASDDDYASASLVSILEPPKPSAFKESESNFRRSQAKDSECDFQEVQPYTAISSLETAREEVELVREQDQADEGAETHGFLWQLSNAGIDTQVQELGFKNSNLTHSSLKASTDDKGVGPDPRKNSEQGEDLLAELEKPFINAYDGIGIERNNEISKNISSEYYKPRQIQENPSPITNMPSAVTVLHDKETGPGFVTGERIYKAMADYNNSLERKPNNEGVDSPLRGQYCLYPPRSNLATNLVPEREQEQLFQPPNYCEAQFPEDQNQVQHRMLSIRDDNDDEFLDGDKAPEPYFPHRDEIPVPDPYYVFAHTSEEFHPLVVTSYKKDCRTWLWKSPSQRSSRLDEQRLRNQQQN